MTVLPLCDRSYHLAMIRLITLLSAALAVTLSVHAQVARLPAGDTQRRASASASISVLRLLVPENAKTAYNRALLAYGTTKLDEAMQQVNKALKTYANFPDALILRGLIQSAEKRDDQAEQDMLAALQSDPFWDVSYLALGNLYNRQHRWDDAVQVLKRGISCCNLRWEGHYELARALVAKQQYAAAMGVLDGVGQSDRIQHPLLRLPRAIALVGLGRPDEATRYLECYLSEDSRGEGVTLAHNILNSIERARRNDVTVLSRNSHFSVCDEESTVR